jgi:signal transduction histidine kinase
MILHTPTSVVFIGAGMSLAGTLDVWMHTHFAEPLTVAAMHTIPEALVYLQSHRVDLILVDEATAQTELRTIHSASPTTAIIGLIMKMDESVQLLMLRQGVHEVLCLLPSTDADHAHTVERALARVNGRAGLLKSGDPRPDIAAAPPRLIHDLNNLLTSINGFADLLLAQLPADNPARMGVEHIRLAGKRAATLLKANMPTSAGPSAPSPSATPSAPSIIARAA